MAASRQAAAARTPTDSVIQWPTERARAWLASFAARSQEDENVVAIVAIGSAVRPAAAVDDLDILALCRDRSALKERAPIEVDVRKANVHRVDVDIQHGDVLLTWAVLFGQPLLDTDHTWADIVQRWRDSVPLPAPDASLERARGVHQRMRKMREVGDDNALCDLNLSYLTHLAWARLAKARVFPRSRPEIPGQLEEIGEGHLAAQLAQALATRHA